MVIQLTAQTIMEGSKYTQMSGPLVKQLLASLDSVLCNCDKVIWRGDQAIPDAAQVIELLKEHWKRVFFITSNSTKSWSKYANKVGLSAREEMFGTVYCCTVYLKSMCKLESRV